MFHGKRHPQEMRVAEVEVFLTNLAVEGRVSASTQNQALNLPWLDNVVRAKRPQRLPVVLTRSEVREVLVRMSGVYGLMANMLYGTGMRLMECVRLRVKDVDFERGAILIRDGKGGNNRIMMLPSSMVAGLQGHLEQRRALFEDDKRIGKADAFLPDALARKYPNAGTESAGSIFFLPAVICLTRAVAWNAATILTRNYCSGR